jgi:molybdate transport system substrate-binding protein
MLRRSLTTQTRGAALGELKLYSTIGVRGPVEALIPQFETASGDQRDATKLDVTKLDVTKLAVTWGTAPMLVKRIEGGENPDVVILSRAGIDRLSELGKIAPGSAVALASSGVAIAVKAGARHPDISTPEALTKTLRAATSISYSEPAAGGASGVYFAKLLERMGIAQEMSAKTKYPPAGGFSASLLLTGEAELAVQQKPELLCVPGVEIVGFLPGAFNMVTEFAAGLMADCADAEAGRALVAMLHSPAAAAVFRAKGLDPA